jgi:hypothetical protein
MLALGRQIQKLNVVFSLNNYRFACSLSNVFVMPPFILICSLLRLFIIFGCIAAHAHASETIITLVVRARAEAESANQSIVAQPCQAACQEKPLQAREELKKSNSVGVFV